MAEHSSSSLRRKVSTVVGSPTKEANTLDMIPPQPPSNLMHLHATVVVEEEAYREQLHVQLHGSGGSGGAGQSLLSAASSPLAHDKATPSASTSPSTTTSSAFFQVHDLLTLSPAANAQRLRASNNNGNEPSTGAATSPSLAAADDPLDSFFPWNYPMSLYGPYAEAYPHVSPAHLNVPHFSSNSTSTTPVAGGGAGAGAGGSSRPLLSQSMLLNSSTVLGSSIGSPTVGDRLPMDDRTLYELAQQSLPQTCRDFGADWAAALRTVSFIAPHVLPASSSPGQLPGTLSLISARLAALDRIAQEYSQFVTPIATTIAEARHLAIHQRPFRPMPTHPHVYIIKGSVFVISEAPARVKLFGGHADAARAASNEIRAIRTVLGNPLLQVFTPLCCTVAVHGVTVFVSCPIPLARNPQANLAQGGFSSKRVAVTSAGLYAAYQLGEFIPLLRHNVPEGSLGATANPESNATVTACDVKLFQNSRDGALYMMDAARYIPTSCCSTASYSKAKTKEDGMGAKGLSRHPLEDEPLAYLSTLFRPEYMRNWCQIQLNADANTPHQPVNSQENTSHAVHTLCTHNVSALALDLMVLEQSKQLSLRDIGALLHAKGVNLRYLGRIYRDVEGSSRSAEVREGLKRKLAVEAACRTFKTLLRLRLADDTRKHDDQAVIQYYRQFLLCSDDGAAFWEKTLLPLMQKKFGFAVMVAVTHGASGAGADGSSSGVYSMPNGSDGTFEVFRCLNAVKRRVQKETPALGWRSVGCGNVSLDDEGVAKLHRQAEDTLVLLYPLIGPSARENASLLLRAGELTGVELACDLRGKKIVVTHKPKVKPCCPLVLSEAIRAVVENGPRDLQRVLETSGDPVALCEAVETAARAELQEISRIAESDPRATTPLQLLALSYGARSMLQQAYVAACRCFDLRKNSPIDVVVGRSALDFAPLFVKAGNHDRAETLVVEGFVALRPCVMSMDPGSYARCINDAMNLVILPSLMESLSAGAKPSLERLQRVMEYLYYAVFLADQFELAPLSALALSTIAYLRRRLAQLMPCGRCGAASEFFYSAEHDPSFDKVFAADVQSVNSRGAGGATGSTGTGGGGGAASVANTNNRRLNQTTSLQRRRKEDPGRRGTEAEDLNEAFAKRSLERVSSIFLDNIPNGPTRESAAAAVPSTSGATSPLQALQQATAAALAAAGEIANIPTRGFPLADQPKPAVICKPQRYFCNTCATKHLGSATLQDGREPVTKDSGILYSRISQLALGNLTGLRAAHRNLLGEAFLNLGVLETHVDLVRRSIEEFAKTYGEGSRHTIAVQIQLADVIVQFSKSIKPQYGTSTQSTTNEIAKAEEVLQETLKKILLRPFELQSELNVVVRNIQSLTGLYANFPAAKKEHAAAHFLVEVLPAALGDTHPLVGAVHHQLQSYYVNLAKKRGDRYAASTALQTAGKHACLALKARVAVPDIAEEIDSLLTVLSDDIIKILRAGGSAIERTASEEIFLDCKSIISLSNYYRQHPLIVQRLQATDEIFRTQHKVVAMSETLAKHAQYIDDAKERMLEQVRLIKQHRNRADLYGRRCLREITSIRDEVKSRVKAHLTAPDIAAKFDALIELHDELTAQPSVSHSGGAPEGGHDMDSGSPVEQAGESANSGNSDGPSKTMGNHTDPSSKGAVKGGSEQADGGAKNGSGSLVGKNVRAYISPYAILGGAPQLDTEVDTAQPVQSRSNLRSAGGLSTASKSLHRGSSGSGSASGSSGANRRRDARNAAPLLNVAEEQYMQSLLYGPSPSRSAPVSSFSVSVPASKAAGEGAQGEGDDATVTHFRPAGIKRPQTVAALSKILPVINQANESRNYNPIKIRHLNSSK